MRHRRHVRALWFLWLLPLLACEPKEAAPAADAAELLDTVKIHLVGRADIVKVLTYVVDLEAETEIRVFSPIPDRILDFPWQDGDEIEAGARVALIRKEGMDQGLQQIQAQIEALDVQIGHLRSEVKRSRELLKAHVITKQVFDQVDAQLRGAVAQRKAVVAGKAQLAASAENAVIEAPIGGVIASKRLEVGDMAIPQVPLCRILAVDRVQGTIDLAEADLAKVRVNHEVQVHLDAYPERTFIGRISTILPYLEPATRTNTAEFLLDNPKDAATGRRPLKPGMYGTARLELERHDQVVVVPEHALLLDTHLLARQARGERLRKAFVIDAQGVARRRTVRLGAREGSLVQVLDGVAEGERVVVRGHHGLDDGQRVEIVGP